MVFRFRSHRYDGCTRRRLFVQNSTIISFLLSEFFFIVGSEESQSFRHLGLIFTELSNGIEFSTKEYGLSCKEIPTSPLGPDRDRKLSPPEITMLKQLSGQLNWVTTQSRPDISFENCMVGNRSNHETVREIFTANRVLRRLRENEISLFFPRLDTQSCYFVGFCDASFANLPDNGSQGAYIIFLIDKTGSYSHGRAGAFVKLSIAPLLLNVLLQLRLQRHVFT